MPLVAVAVAQHAVGDPRSRRAAGRCPARGSRPGGSARSRDGCGRRRRPSRSPPGTAGGRASGRQDRRRRCRRGCGWSWSGAWGEPDVAAVTAATPRFRSPEPGCPTRSRRVQPADSPAEESERPTPWAATCIAATRRGGVPAQAWAPRCRAPPPPLPRPGSAPPTEQAPRLISSHGGGVVLGEHPAQLPRSTPGWLTVYGVIRVRCDEHLLLHGRRRVGQQHLADAGGVQRQPRADGADDGHRGVAGEAVDVEHLDAVADREVHGGEGGAVEVVQVRRGDVAQAGLHGRQQPDVPEPAPDDVVPRRRTAQRAPRDQLAHQPVRGRARAARRARPARSA